MFSATSNLDVNNSLSQGQATLLGFLFNIRIIMIIIKYGRNQVNEKHLSAVVDEFETKYNNDEKISEDIMIDDYKVIGIITIPKINLKYPILDRTDNKG